MNSLRQISPSSLKYNRKTTIEYYHQDITFPMSDIHIEIAADYLVMAAWLTYLKSRLLLPKEEKTDEYTACLLYTSPSPRDPKTSRMPSSA